MAVRKIDGIENNANNPSFRPSGQNIGQAPANYADRISSLGNVGFPTPVKLEK